MITNEQYINAVKSIRENQAIVDEYLSQQGMTTETRFKGLELSEIQAVKSTLTSGEIYFSFQVKGKEVQRITELSPGLQKGYWIEHARYSAPIDKALKNLAMWFKRRGAAIKPQEFVNKFLFIGEII